MTIRPRRVHYLALLILPDLFSYCKNAKYHTIVWLANAATDVINFRVKILALIGKSELAVGPFLEVEVIDVVRTAAARRRDRVVGGAACWHVGVAPCHSSARREPETIEVMFRPTIPIYYYFIHLLRLGLSRPLLFIFNVTRCWNK